MHCVIRNCERLSNLSKFYNFTNLTNERTFMNAFDEVFLESPQTNLATLGTVRDSFTIIKRLLLGEWKCNCERVFPSHLPFQIVSTRTRFFRLLANVILQESRGTGTTTIFFRVKTISVAFTTSKVERHATLLQVIEIPSRRKLLTYRHCVMT